MIGSQNQSQNQLKLDENLKMTRSFEDDASQSAPSKMTLPKRSQSAQLPAGLAPWLRNATNGRQSTGNAAEGSSGMEGSASAFLFSLEDADVAAVTRLQEDLPAAAMIPEPTAAVEGPPEGYSR